MKFFLPDAQDLVDPSFDFATERRSPTRERQRDDLYGHEVFSSRPFDGYLVSKVIVEGYRGLGSRYTLAQRHRLRREGAQSFFRTRGAPVGPLSIMGDCGAFTYRNEPVPPYSVDDVLTFYEQCGFDMGVSVDHVILDFNEEWDKNKRAVPKAHRQRRELTLELAAQFRAEHRRRRCRFEAMGVAQGWSPQSFAESVAQLQGMGYTYIALGGMVPMKTTEIHRTLDAIQEVRRVRTRLHLLGVTRLDLTVPNATRLGIASIDSTSPFMQAFKDASDNYYTPEGPFSAIRVPQVDANPSLQRRVRSGEIAQERAQELERRCLAAMQEFAAGRMAVSRVLAALREYELLVDPKSDHREEYRRTLEARPWTRCPCDICRVIGHNVILFRGAERNKRRGLHNVWVFYQGLASQISERRSASRSA